MIDLHTHTTASDGRCTPPELVARAAEAGVTVLAVTDHDTFAACEAAAAACVAANIEPVPGIEITAVCEGDDVHLLGYFIHAGSPALHAFLTEQRRHRIDRVRQMVQKLAALGIALDADEIVRPALDDARRSAGRPWIARALVATGHAATFDEAFQRWLARGKPAFVERAGASPEQVIAAIHAAGGVASLAHPALVEHDDWIPGFVSAGLDAIEAYHSEHDAEATRRYVEMASALGIALSGGSDYHGDLSHGPSAPGAVSLPREAYDKLRGLRATRPATASGHVTSSYHNSSQSANRSPSSPDSSR